MPSFHPLSEVSSAHMTPPTSLPRSTQMGVAIGSKVTSLFHPESLAAKG